MSKLLLNFCKNEFLFKRENISHCSILKRSLFFKRFICNGNYRNKVNGIWTKDGINTTQTTADTFYNENDDRINRSKAPTLLASSFSTNVGRFWYGDSSTIIHPEELIYPLFVSDIPNIIEEIEGFPEQYRVGTNRLVDFIGPLVERGLKSILIFGSVENTKKNLEGTYADNDDSPVIKSLKILSKSFPNLCLICDVCLCAYTTGGICGVGYKNDCTIINLNESTDRLAQISLNYANAGCHIVAPSDMLDGRVHKINKVLLQSNIRDKISIMSYASKYSSSFYGPFRSACNSNFEHGKRRSNQLPSGSYQLGNRALLRDVDEGSDFIICKPGMPYMDMIKNAKDKLIPNIPIIAYQVSGEYGMLYYGAKHNCFDLEAAVRESITCFKRAGCSAIISYFTPKVLEWLKKN